MWYYEECEGCGKALDITGAYIGHFSNCWCEACGFEGENLTEEDE